MAALQEYYLDPEAEGVTTVPVILRYEQEADYNEVNEVQQNDPDAVRMLRWDLQRLARDAALTPDELARRSVASIQLAELVRRGKLACAGENSVKTERQFREDAQRFKGLINPLRLRNSD